MSRGWQWKSGDWWICCDVCSKQIYASESLKRWDGLIVCKDDFETRHPQDLIHVRPERQTVPFTRPEPEDQFVVVDYIDTGDDPDPFVTYYVESGYVTTDYFETGTL